MSDTEIRVGREITRLSKYHVIDVKTGTEILGERVIQGGCRPVTEWTAKGISAVHYSLNALLKDLTRSER